MGALSSWHTVSPMSAGTRMGAGDCRFAGVPKLPDRQCKAPSAFKIYRRAASVLSHVGRTIELGAGNGISAWAKHSRNVECLGNDGGIPRAWSEQCATCVRTDHQSRQAPNSSAQHRAWTGTRFAHADGEMAECCGRPATMVSPGASGFLGRWRSCWTVPAGTIQQCRSCGCTTCTTSTICALRQARPVHHGIAT